MGTDRAQARRVEAWAMVLLGVVLLVLLLIPLRVLQLQIRPDPQLAAAAGRTESSVLSLAHRGDVLDRRGRVLATSTLGWRVFVDPVNTPSPSLVGAHLASVLGIDASMVDRHLSGKLNRRFVPVTDVLGEADVAALRQYPMRGVGLEPRPHSTLPKRAGSRQSGWTGRLRPHRSGRRGAHSATPTGRASRSYHGCPRHRRRRTLWVSPDAFVAPRDGTDVRLSIDLAVQTMAEQRLRRAVQETGAAGGRLVILDPVHR